MNWETEILVEDIEVAKEKIDDLRDTFVWFGNEYFSYEPNHLLTKEEIKKHGYKYHEHRRYISQHIDLLGAYLERLDTALENVKKASLPTDQSESNAD
ncbi:pathogenicity island family protein [Staphylococcus devriesei]|nr:pathogenicity island family protein [Staphylococcus devriesei]